MQALGQLPSFDTLVLVLGLEMPQYDTREVYQSGVPFERQSDLFVAAGLNSDASRPLVLNGDVFGYRLFATGPERPAWGWGWDASVIWHPADALETRVDASYGHKPQGARWLDTDGAGQALFGFQDPAFLSVTLRQQLVLSPRLTLQVYAQLFSEAVRYGPGWWSAPLAGKQSLAGSQLLPSGPPADDPNAHSSALNLNAVLRWEYRLGSTLFLVYTRSQAEAAPGLGPVATSALPSRLFNGPANDTFMLKWSYWVNL